MRQQADVLAAAARHVRGGGRLAYATCSLMACENGERIRAFLEDDPNWEIIVEESLTPLDGGYGFYIAVLRKALC